MDSGLPFWGGRDDPTIYLGPVTSVVGTVGDILPTVRLRGHRENVTDFAFSADGQLLVSGSADGTVRLWRVPDFEE
jgi:WD40 repeat protein